MMDSAGSPQARALHYWEYVFFAGLFGVIALYPFAMPLIPFVADNERLFILLALASIAAFAAIALYYESHERRKKKWVVMSVFAAVCAAALIGYAALNASIVFTVWFIDAALALFCFGYVCARHLFHRVEKDFRHTWHRIIVTSIIINLFVIIGVALAAAFPLPLVALIAGGLMAGKLLL